jgi:hypothetical protein
MGLAFSCEKHLSRSGDASFEAKCPDEVLDKAIVLSGDNWLCGVFEQTLMEKSRVAMLSHRMKSFCHNRGNRQGRENKGVRLG